MSSVVRKVDNQTAMLLFVAASLVFVALSRGVFLYGDDVLMFQVTESIVERGAFDVSAPYVIGSNANPSIGDDGRGYAKYGIGQSLVAIPMYIVSDLLLEPLLPLEEARDPFGNLRLGPLIFGTTLTNALLAGASVALLWLLARAVGYRRQTAFALALLLAFTTPLAHYAAGFLSEPLTMFTLLLTVYGLMKATTGKPRQLLLWLALSGVAAGLALASRIAIGVALVAPALWLLWLAWGWSRQSWRTAVLACLAWGTPITLWLIGIATYNQIRFGSIFESGYGNEARDFTEPFLTGLTGLLLSPGKGVLWYSPALFLALAGGWRFYRRQRPLALVIVGMFVPLIALYSRYYSWEGGGVWGSRFLLPLLPLLLLPAGEIIERLWQPSAQRRWASIAVVALALLGGWVSFISVVVPFDRYVHEYNATSEQHHDAIWTVEDSPIVVHTERAFDFTTGPDIAAVRYNVMRLALLSVVMLLAGFAILGWLWRDLHTRGPR